MKARLSHHKQSPRKTRLVANLIKGKSVAEADAQLAHSPKRVAKTVRKVLASAVANAKEHEKVDAKDLAIKNVRVDDGIVIKRHRARARGRAMTIRHRRSHINLELKKKAQKSSAVAETKKEKMRSKK